MHKSGENEWYKSYIAITPVDIDSKKFIQIPQFSFN